MRKPFSICIIFLFPLALWSQQKMLTIQQAIATALQNNYDVQLSRNDSMIAALNYSYRNAAFLPTLNGNISYLANKNNQKQDFIDGTKREGDVKTKTPAVSLALNWTLFDGLKMFATREKIEQFVHLGELEIKRQLVNTIANVINTYYNIVKQKQQLKAVEEQISIDEERVKLAQYKLDIGAGAKPDLLQSKVDLNAQKAAKLAQQTLISQLKDQLNQVMNIPTGNAYEVHDSIPLNTGLALENILNGIDASNPSLLIAKKNIDIAGLVLKESKASLFPILAFNSAYNFNRTTNDITLNPAFPVFTRNQGYNYGFTATVPILNNLTARRIVKQAQLGIQYQQLVYDNQKSLVNVTVVNAYQDYELQKKSLALEEENILLAKENVSIVLESYRLGVATLIQLKEAQKSLEDAYNRLIAARYNTKLAETSLLSLKGDLVK